MNKTTANLSSIRPIVTDSDWGSKDDQLFPTNLDDEWPISFHSLLVLLERCRTKNNLISYQIANWPICGRVVEIVVFWWVHYGLHYWVHRLVLIYAYISLYILRPVRSYRMVCSEYVQNESYRTAGKGNWFWRRPAEQQTTNNKKRRKVFRILKIEMTIQRSY